MFGILINVLIRLCANVLIAKRERMIIFHSFE